MTKLKKIRTQHVIRAAELAKILCVSRSCICLAEKKGIRNVKTAKRYAKALGCSPAELLEF